MGTHVKKYRSFLLIIVWFIGFVGVYYGVAQHPIAFSLATTSKGLSPTTISVLTALDTPFQLTLYSPDPEKNRYVQTWITRYQHFSSMIRYEWKPEHYTFSDTLSGETLIVQHHQHVRYLDLNHTSIDEATLTTLLLKMLRRADRWVVFLQGHGEPDLYGTHPRDLSLWRKALENQGFKIHALTLSQTPVIADNTGLLVILSPPSEWLLEEEKLVTRYIEKGGNVLWLLDPFAKSLVFLQELFGVEPISGTIIDLHGQHLGTPHPAITLIENYPKLPFSPPKLLTAYPWAVALHTTPLDTWETQPLLLTHEATWTERDPITGQIEHNPEQGEIAGPLLLGVSLRRSVPHADSPQRIAVIGNQRFLSNGAIQNYANLAFSQSLMNWLNHDDLLLSIEQPVCNDSFSHIHRFTAYLIQFGFPGLGVLLLVGAGVYSYYRGRFKYSTNRSMRR